MTTTQWRESGQLVDIDGIQIFLKKSVTGKKENILLLHGFPSASWDWHKIWPDLINEFDVYAFDFVGFGFSDKPRDIDYSLHLQADITEKLLSQQSLAKLHILAHNYGVSVAQELIARQNLDEKAERSFTVQTVCYLNGGLFFERLRPRFIQRLLLSTVGNLIVPFLNTRTLRRNMTNIFGPKTPPTDSEIEAFWELIMWNDGKFLMPQLLHFLEDREVHNDRWVKAIQLTKIPQRLINGREDPVSGLHMAEYYAEKIEGADVVILEDIGHYPNLEAPDQVTHHYLEFLKKHIV